jgi:hypothetical protein
MISLFQARHAHESQRAVTESTAFNGFKVESRDSHHVMKVSFPATLLCIYRGNFSHVVDSLSNAYSIYQHNVSRFTAASSKML